MPNEPIIEKTGEDFAAKLASQDIAGQSTKGEASPDSLQALDALAAEHTKKKEDEAAAAAKKAAEPKKAAVTVETKDKAAAPATAPDDAKAKAEDEAKKKAEGEDEAKKKAAHESALKQVDETFKDIQLPPGARAKSAEAFATVKLKAAQEISELQAKLAAAESAIKEKDEKLKNPVPPETAAELAELRTFRAKFDIEADPKWKEYDTKAKATNDFIYSQLRKHPSVITDEVIKEIEKNGGPVGVNMDKILDAIGDPTTKRIVLSKLADLEQNSFEKEQAIKAAKDHADEFVKTRGEEMTKAAEAHTVSTAQEFKKLLPEMPWLDTKTAADNASEDDKKSVEQHNEWVKETRTLVESALRDDSAQMRALQLAGMAQLLFLQKVHEATKLQLKKVEGDLAASNAKIEEFKSAKTTRLREVLPTGGPVPAAKDKDIFHKTAQESLDDIRSKILADKEAKAAGQ